MIDLLMMMAGGGIDVTKPVKSFDGSVVPEESGWGGWVWVMGGVWGVALLVVAWVAVVRHRNRMGADVRVAKRIAEWRSLTRAELAAVREMAADVEGKEAAEVIAGLLLPARAEVMLNRAWDRTEGVKRAGLISLRMKLGVLEAERQRESMRDGKEIGATISLASSPSSVRGLDHLEMEAQREHSN